MSLFTALFQSSARGAAIALMGLGAVGGVFAQQKPVPTEAPLVKVEAAWVRATAQGQLGTGAFMNLTSRTSTQLIGVSTPSAAVAEVHEMRMEGDIMKMRAVSALDLPAGSTVQLKPGGYHLMLMDLKQPLAKGSSMPLTLHFKDAKGVQSKMQVQVPVLTAAPGAAPAPHSAHHHAKP